MFRFSRTYQYTAEFEARQSGFDFAVVARAVLEIAVEAKAKLKAMAKSFIKALRPAPLLEKPVQFGFDWNGIGASSKNFCHQGV